MVSYPENIIRGIGLEKVFGCNYYTELSQDQLAGLEYALSTLSDREQSFLEMRYKRGLSYNEIARRVDRSRSRITQIIEQAIHKLSRKHMTEYIAVGYQALEQRRKSHAHSVKRTSSKMTSEELKVALGTLATERVEDFDIDIRTVNALQRSGIDTLFRLLEMLEERPDALIRVRNIGKKSAMEIIDLLRRYGLGDWADLAEMPLKGIHLHYPENLIARLDTEEVLGPPAFVSLTQDQLQGLEYAISTLKDDERHVLQMHYQEHLSLPEIGDRIGKPYSRVGVLIHDSLDALRRPFRSRYFIKGFHVVEEENRAMADHSPQKTGDDMTDEMIKDALGPYADVHIKDLDLDIRTINCLTRGGLNTVFDLITLLHNTPVKFFRIRNVGPKVAKTVFEWMQQSGLGDWIPEKKHI